MGDSAAHRPAPTATGTLARTPLVHLIVYVLERQLSGTLELSTPDKRAATVLFAAGRPAKVRTTDAVAYLGRVLLELGFINEEQLTRSLADLAREKASGRRLHGEILAAQGAVNDAQLDAGLREQTARKLRHAAGLPPHTTYAYFDGFDALSQWGHPTLVGSDPLPTLWPLLREFPPWEQVSAAIDSKRASAMRLRPDVDVARLGLAGAELEAVKQLTARPMRPADLGRAAKLDERTGQLLAYLLLLTKQVDLLAAEAPVAAPSPSPPPAAAAHASRPPAEGLGRPLTPFGAHKPGAPGGRSDPPAGVARASLAPGGRMSLIPPPPGLSQELLARWTEINERASMIDRADYFSMLDVSRDATREEVESAYVALAKRWHPDRLPPELAPIRDACSRVFSRMSEARATLVDAEKRDRYTKLADDGSGTPETQERIARVVDASTNFQKAEVCLKRNDLAQAEVLARKALELDDSQPDYLALVAWLEAQKPENQGGDQTLACIQQLDKAVKMSNRCEKALFWRGMLYKRLGRTDMAAKDFRRVADLNPRNIDAAREVRLFNMRGGRTSAPPPPPQKETPTGPPKGDDKGGLFGRFFKKP